MKNVSPLRYPGGKTRACKVLESLLNEHFDINSFDTLVSPFFGGGSFEFFIQNAYGLRVSGNDKFTPLFTFWKSCKMEKEKLCDALTAHLGKVDKTTFGSMRQAIMRETDKLKQSIMYFVINRCSFSGATLSGGFSAESSNKRFTGSSIERIRNLDLSKVTFHNLDFEPFLDRHTETDESKCLIFLDPPYYIESNLYGKNGDMHDSFDHKRLHECLSKRKNWIMTYNNCEYIKNLYSEFKIIETGWSYGMNKSKKSSEIVIIG